MPVATANGKKFSFPDGTTPEQMGQAIDEYFSQQQSRPAQQALATPPPEAGINVPKAEQEGPYMQAWEPGIVRQAIDTMLPSNPYAASNELAARDVANEQNIPVSEVYDQAGGSRPMGDPMGRSGFNAITEGLSRTDQAIEEGTNKALESGATDSPLPERIGEAVPRGFNNMVDSLGVAKFVVAGGDAKQAAAQITDKILRNQEIRRAPSEEGIYAGIESVNNADGALESISSGVRAATEFFGNPSDATVISAEQAPNTLPALGLAGAGAGLGYAAGNAPGAVIGGKAGLAAGTAAVELGAEVEQAVQENLTPGASGEQIYQEVLDLLSNPEFVADARARGLRKGLTVAAVDQAFLVVGGKLANTQGVKAKAGAVGLDMSGEGAGEAASQYAATGEVKPGDALLEGLASAPTSVAETAMGAAMERSKTKGGANTETEEGLAIEQPEAVQPEPTAEPEPVQEQQAEAEQVVDQEQQPEPEQVGDNGTGYFRANTADIQVDPDQYQFRTKVNKSGVDNRLDGIQDWDDNRAGAIIVHRRKDGQMYVADGHHRLDLAKRLGQDQINVRYLDEADGWTVEDVRAEAAMVNIANDKAEPIDIAKVIRDTKMDAKALREEHNLPNSQIVRDGQALSALEDNVFGMVSSGQLNEKDGAAIGSAFEPGKQEAAADVFQKVQPKTEEQRQLLINEINAADFAETQGEQGGLFGDDPQEISLMQDRLKVLDSLKGLLRSDKKLFASLNRNADKAQKVGNKIAKEANEDISKESQKALDIINRVATTPDLNAIVSKAAKRVFDGEKVAAVTKDLKEELLNYDPRAEQENSGRRKHSQSSEPSDQPGNERAADKRVSEKDNDGADQKGQSDVRSEESQDLLSTYSEKDLQEKTEKEDQQKKEKAEAESRAEEKEKADKQVDSFSLTGSDLPADSNPDQGDILSQEIDQSAHEAATSPKNDLPEPTEAQKEAGNYKLGKIKVHGLNISIENPEGSTRSGTSPDGKQWSNTMGAHYGYLAKTEGADGDHVDVFIGDNPESEKVWIIDQVNQDGSFDEHKVLLGFKNKMLAREAYTSSYDKGWTVGPITAMSIDQFKDWLQGDTTKPLKPAEIKQAPSTEGVSRSGAKKSKPLSEIVLKRQAKVEETGDIVTIEEQADVKWRQMEKRGETLKALLDCVRM